jgi:hypothetical protein
MRSFLSDLKDEGPAYDPPHIRLRVISPATDVRSTVLAKRDGSVAIYLRRAVACWDPFQQERIVVEEVPVVIASDGGSRLLGVDHRVQSLLLGSTDTTRLYA